MNKKESTLHKFLRKHGVVTKFKALLFSEEDNGMCTKPKHPTYEDYLKAGETDPDAIWGAFMFPFGDDFDLWAKLAIKYERVINEQRNR